MESASPQPYKERFEHLFRVALKVTSTLQIGQMLELLRDEARLTIPHAEEVCLLLFDPEAAHYTRPLHCAVFQDRLNCQLCKRGRETVQSSLACPWVAAPPAADAAAPPPREVAIPICQDGQPLAILSATARAGQAFSALELVLLQDLLDLAGNVLLNARQHWKMEQEKWTLDRILGHLRPFVPETVQRIVEKNPEAPHLEKRDLNVSILFLDVAGYTRISQTLTREKVNFIIEKYFSSFLDVIYAHGGDINETAGDGLMVIFQGAETAHALDAARAALTIRTRTGELNQELAGRFMPLRVNMGLNSGTVALGMTQFHGTAGTRMTFTASGPVTNLASRIAAAATDGDILVGPETARRITPAIPCYDRGIMDFKNILAGVRIASLVHPGSGNLPRMHIPPEGKFAILSESPSESAGESAPEPASINKEDRMRDLKGAKTEKHLAAAFAGESQARNKYTYFASVAKREGYEEIAKIFLETAENEKEHAKLHFRALSGIGDTVANLKAAAGGEDEEAASMYPQMAKDAREEGFEDIARTFEQIGQIEAHHRDRYRAILQAVETGRVFKKEQKVRWRCRNCGYIHEGTSAVSQCPVCKHPQAYFEVVNDNF